MYRGQFAPIFLMIFISSSTGQIDLESKINAIYDDMDRYPIDKAVTLPEMVDFFQNLTRHSIEIGLNIYDFDFQWHKRYFDYPTTTIFFFERWDVDGNDLLNTTDVDALFAVIDVVKSPSTPDWLHYESEFLPYMWNLYADAKVAA